ncbi:sirohydrochlorin chelatase [Williamsia sp. CHRR-6]|uniref:sirohydrochlorin chelatase n=1 Tax=Williamsia sp. CHRR-6 TaxID=2835871 RepID=UPI001BDA76C4|nr:sirohydrochlorin chelatase [Williamsia sp. CHRR-6]MBT0565640.1 sirohydrochlorin chelatase [Williamsia sp. CHRR-6]
MTDHRCAVPGTPILVAHGTRSQTGVDTVHALADLVATQIGPLRVAFVDVLGPSPEQVLRETAGPAIVVPAFLAAGYHVRQDIPNNIAASGHTEVTVTDSLGPDPVIASVLRERLVAAGWQPGDAVILAAAGSSDPSACDDVRTAAAQLALLTDSPVDTAFITSASPRVPCAVAAARINGARRVVIAAYLLAPGLFHTRLAQVGADAVTEPIGADPAIVDLLVHRFTRARVRRAGPPNSLTGRVATPPRGSSAR